MKFFLLAGLITIHCSVIAQLSEGKGETVKLADGELEIFLPQHFVVSKSPLGVKHNVSRTLIYIIEVPSQHHSKIDAGDYREFLVDKSMAKVALEKRSGNAYGRGNHDVEFIQFEIAGVKFERLNSFIRHKEKLYLLMANYPVSLKSQVFDEVQKVYGSIKFLK